MGLQTPSTHSVPSPIPLLGIQPSCSVQLLAANIHLCVYKALAGPLRRQPYQAPFSMHFLASTIVSRFGIWDESPGGTVSGDSLSFSLCSTLYFHICSCDYFVLLLRRTEASKLWASFLLNFMWSVNFILGIWRFWANIHL
jgi:hypothetical protein